MNKSIYYSNSFSRFFPIFIKKFVKVIFIKYRYDRAIYREYSGNLCFKISSIKSKTIRMTIYLDFIIDLYKKYFAYR